MTRGKEALWEETIQERMQTFATNGTRRSLAMVDYPAQNDLSNEERRFHFASNDYLGLAHDERMIAAQVAGAKRFGASASASCFASGRFALYEQAETLLARWKQTEKALIVGSGYAANIGVLSSLLTRHDIVFSDRLNHASIVDGIRLSGASHKRYRHCDVDHLAQLLEKAPVNRRKVIVTDTLFSMDGDRAPLTELLTLKKAHNALLIVDEAHATGLFGVNGAGLCYENDIYQEVDVIVGTFGKALGSLGAYVTGKRLFVDYLESTMRSFIYTTALPPAVIQAIICALELIQTDEFEQKRQKVLEHATYFRNRLTNLGLSVGTSTTQIVPLIVGENDRALALARLLRANAIVAAPIRPPTVPTGHARLRFALHCHHDRDTLDDVVGVIAGIAAKRRGYR